MSNQTFIDSYLQGKALAEDIEDYIDQWHESQNQGELHEFLGLTWDEYSLWVKNDEQALPWIAAARKENRSANDIVYDIENIPLAARSNTPFYSEAMKKWLKEQDDSPEHE